MVADLSRCQYQNGGMTHPARKNTQADYVKTALRLPPDLHEQLHAGAQSTGRSLNNEILTRLYKSFDAESETEKLRKLTDLMRDTLQLHRHDAERSKVSVLAMNLVVSELVQHIYRGKKTPPEVQDIIDRANRISASMQEDMDLAKKRA